MLGHLFLTGQTGESEMLLILSVGKDRWSSHLVGQLCLWFCMVLVLNPCGAKALATCCDQAVSVQKVEYIRAH